MKNLTFIITRPRSLFLLLIILFSILFFTNGVPFIYSDGYAPYHTAYSIVNNQSFVSEIEPEYIDYKGHVVDYFNEKYSVVYPPGTSILNVPLMNLASELKFTGDTVYTDYFMSANGHTFAEGLSFLITAYIFALVTIYFLYKALIELKFSRKIASFAVFFAYFSSYAIWYVFLHPSFSHTYEMMAITVSLWSFIKLQNSKNNKFSLISGFMYGLAVLIRPVLIAFGIVIAIRLLFKAKYKSLFYFVLGGIPNAVLLFLYNYISYGKFLATGYGDVRGENFDFSTFNGLNILFSQYRGWFIYTPIAFLALIGLILMYKKARFLSVLSIVFIASLVIIYGFWPSWWAGGSYGQRFLIATVPFLSIGLAYILNRYKSQKVFNKLIWLIALTFTLWSIGLTLMYRFTPVAELKHITDNKDNMLSKDRYTPKDILNFQYSLLNESSDLNSYINNITRNANGGISLAALYLGEGKTVLRLDSRKQNTIDILKLKPPTVNYELDFTTGFIHIEPKGKYYQIILKDLNMNDLYSIECIEECKSNTDNVELISIDSFKILSKKEYTGIEVNDSTNIYFKNTPNLLFKGKPIQLPDNQNYYH